MLAAVFVVVDVAATALAWLLAYLLRFHSELVLGVLPVTKGVPPLRPYLWLLPLIALATLATVVASQAMISGSFSIARQALHLGYSPRLEVRHSSAEEIGQVYVPLVNWVLLLASVGLVLGFGSSERLAGAYGVAVSLTMLITTVFACICARLRWGWSLPATMVIFRPRTSCWLRL